MLESHKVPHEEVGAKPAGEFAVYLALLAVAVVAIWLSLSFQQGWPLGPSLLPQLGAGGMGVAAAIGLFRTARHMREPSSLRLPGRLLVGVGALLLAYPWAISVIGFVPATLALLVLLTAISSESGRGWRGLVGSLVFASGAMAALYLVFEMLLGVPLP